MWWFGQHAFSWGWLLFGGLMMLLFWGSLIALVWFLVRSTSGSGERNRVRDSASSQSALEILKERYARGEIGKAEYEEMRRDIEA